MLKIVLMLVFLFHMVVGQQNPVFPGWYADPEGIIYGNKYWIFPTFSDSWGEQTFFDAFSSPDLVHWTKIPRIIDTDEVSWALGAMWAPSVFQHEDKYYFLFSANDGAYGGGIRISVSLAPEGPYRDLLGRPLINETHNGAHPIDQYVFRDVDGTHYMYYGGWGHCNVVKLSEDFTSLVPFDDGSIYKEVTPEGYTEGPYMFHKDGVYYFMWSEGAWTGPDYKVAYSMSESPLGPFRRFAIILEQDPTIAKGAGHHSVIHVPEQEKYYIVYHRRPLNESHEDHRVTCIDEMKFAPDGTILPVRITHEGVIGVPLGSKPSL